MVHTIEFCCSFFQEDKGYHFISLFCSKVFFPSHCGCPFLFLVPLFRTELLSLLQLWPRGIAHVWFEAEIIASSNNSVQPWWFSLWPRRWWRYLFKWGPFSIHRGQGVLQLAHNPSGVLQRRVRGRLRHPAADAPERRPGGGVEEAGHQLGAARRWQGVQVEEEDDEL